MFFNRFDRHARLVNGMADALGQDLEADMLSGRLSPHGYREKVLRCVGCREAEACEKLLTAAEGFLETPPDYCRNRDALEAMAR